jgi:hypothetical protein
LNQPPPSRHDKLSSIQSILAPQPLSKPEPRDEDSSHLINYQKKESDYDIPDWLRERKGQTHKTSKNYLAGLEDSMHNPNRHKPNPSTYKASASSSKVQVAQARKPAKKTAGEYILATRATHRVRSREDKGEDKW